MLSSTNQKVYILHIALQSSPFWTRIPFRAFQIIGARVDKAAGFVCELPQVGRFDESLKVQAIGFLDAWGTIQSIIWVKRSDNIVALNLVGERHPRLNLGSS